VVGEREIPFTYFYEGKELPLSLKKGRHQLGRKFGESFFFPIREKKGGKKCSRDEGVADCIMKRGWKKKELFGLREGKGGRGWRDANPGHPQERKEGKSFLLETLSHAAAPMEEKARWSCEYKSPEEGKKSHLTTRGNRQC